MANAIGKQLGDSNNASPMTVDGMLCGHRRRGKREESRE